MIVPGAATAALAEILEPGERVIWAGRPDTLATFRTQLVWWWIGVPAMALALTLYFGGFIPRDWSHFPLLAAFAFLAAPVLMTAFAYGTLYVITNQRVIIKHDAVNRKRKLFWRNLDSLDEKFEILPTGDNVGHLCFASGVNTKVPNADYTGKVAFRELRHPEHVAALLEKARQQAAEQHT